MNTNVVAALRVQVLDFAGLLARGYDDPRAPPDGSRPILEDGMHYGCQASACIETSRDLTRNAKPGASLDHVYFTLNPQLGHKRANVIGPSPLCSGARGAR